MGDKKALVVAISGCSSSGKTTIARLLRDIFPHSFILHEDDFYKPEDELPSKHGLLDWDCPEALDIDALSDVLSHIRQRAHLPPSLSSKEDRNSVGTPPVSPSTVAALRSKVLASLPPSHPLRHASLRICLLDGFLLYPPGMAAIHRQLDLRFFLRTTYACAKARRQARDGYVTLEGFWTDPPGYVDNIVWPNYVEQHAWMFVDGDVEGTFDRAALQKHGIRAPPDELHGEDDMSRILEWMVDSILAELEKYNRARYALII